MSGTTVGLQGPVLRDDSPSVSGRSRKYLPVPTLGSRLLVDDLWVVRGPRAPVPLCRDRGLGRVVTDPEGEGTTGGGGGGTQGPSEYPGWECVPRSVRVVPRSHF